MITLDRPLQQAATVEDLKGVIRQLIDELNKGAHLTRQNLIFIEEKNGPVVRNPDNGRYYKIKVTSSTSPAIELEDVGVRIPSGE